MKLGPWEITIIVVIILIIFGVGRLPQIGSSLGKAIHSFKAEQAGPKEEEESEPAKKPRRTARRAQAKKQAEEA